MVQNIIVAVVIVLAVSYSIYKIIQYSRKKGTAVVVVTDV